MDLVPVQGGPLRIQTGYRHHRSHRGGEHRLPGSRCLQGSAGGAVRLHQDGFHPRDIAKPARPLRGDALQLAVRTHTAAHPEPSAGCAPGGRCLTGGKAFWGRGAFTGCSLTGSPVFALPFPGQLLPHPPHQIPWRTCGYARPLSRLRCPDLRGGGEQGDGPLPLVRGRHSPEERGLTSRPHQGQHFGGTQLPALQNTHRRPSSLYIHRSSRQIWSFHHQPLSTLQHRCYTVTGWLVGQLISSPRAKRPVAGGGNLCIFRTSTIYHLIACRTCVTCWPNMPRTLWYCPAAQTSWSASNTAWWNPKSWSLCATWKNCATYTTNRAPGLSLIHISEPTRLRRISYAVFCLK